MKSWWWCRSAGAAILATALGSWSAPAAAQDGSGLFVEASAVAPPLAAADRRTVRRARQVRLDLATLGVIFAPSGVRPAPRLNLFGDVSVALVRERLEADRRGHTTWVGHAAADADSLAALTWDGTYLSGAVVLAGVAYEVAGTADRVVISERWPEPPSAELPSPDPPPTAGDVFRQNLNADGSTARIDLLLVYTPAAKARAGGQAAIESQLANAVAVTNTAYQRSGVDAVLTAVGVQEAAYGEDAAGLGGDLSGISPGGAWNGTLEAARTTTGADLVALVTGRATTSGGCGVAWLGPSSSYAYSVTEQACLYAGQWSFSHELGHNFGARHAAGDSADTTPRCPTYACGYRDANVRTLMAYYVAGGPTLRILNYSSATVREPATAGGPTGSSLQDNARRLGDTAGLIAAFRTVAVPPSPPQSPQGFAASVSGASVVLSWVAPGGGGPVSGYEVEVGSIPGGADLVRAVVGGSPLAVGDVPPGTYFVRLRSVGPGGSSAPTADLVVAVGACVPPGPITLNGSRTANVISLAWSDATGTGPVSYFLGAGTAPGAIDRGVFAMGGATAFATSLSPGAYYVKAAAANGCGMGPISNEVLVIIP